MIRGIHYCRAFAAIGVILYHIATTASANNIETELFEIFKWGNLGVDFFFVISGFIIHYIHHKHFGKANFCYNYAKKRILRVYPIYLSVFFLKFLILLVVGINFKDYQTAEYFLCSMLLIPIENEFPFITVAWTLSHEMTFYILYIIPIALGKYFLYLGIIFWSFLIIFSDIFYSDLYFIIRFLMSPYNLQFIIGILFSIFYLAERKYSVLLFTITSVFFFLIANETTNEVAQRGLTGFGFGFVLLVFVRIDITKINKFIFIDKFLILVGNASYSIYLTHTLLISSIYILIYKYNIYYLGIFALFSSIIIGVLIWLIIENPVLKFLNSKFINK